MCINLDLNIKEGPMDKNDHDLLIEMHTDIKWLKKALSDHLTKHWRFTILVLSLVVGAIVTGKFLG